MSRYTINKPNREYAWGFDLPIREYYFQCFDTTKRNDDNLIFGISSFYSEKPHRLFGNRQSYTRAQILEVIKYEEAIYGEIIPKEHKDALAMDMIF